VVDDGATDNSIDILKNLEKNNANLTIISQPNGGICNALNRGLAESSGEIVGFLGSDDLMVPDRIKNELIYFQNDSELKVLYGNGKFLKSGKYFEDAHKIIGKYLNRGICPTREFITNNCPAMYIQALLIKKDFLESIGSFDEETGSDDWSLNIRIFKALNFDKEFLFLNNNSFIYRLHDNQNHRKVNFMSPMKRKVIRRYYTIEGRAKNLCENSIKDLISLLISGKFKHAFNKCKKIIYIGCKKGIPLKCMGKIALKIPRFIINKINS
jgi:glycosyltransferase involved in cell wall biosynthesis